MDVHDLLHTSQSKTWKKSSRGEGSSSSSSSYGILGGFGKAFGSSNNRFLIPGCLGGMSTGLNQCSLLLLLPK